MVHTLVGKGTFKVKLKWSNHWELLLTREYNIARQNQFANAIRLFIDNASVDKYNNDKLISPLHRVCYFNK